MQRICIKSGVVVFFALLIIATATMCKKEIGPTVKQDAPRPYLLPGSSTNPVADLGRVLFYDKNLSLNNTISCGSCHQQQYAFADNKQYSLGLNNGFTARNSSTIINTQNRNKFWDGRAGDFDTAVFMPVQNHVEMNMYDINLLPPRLAGLSYYPPLFKAAYGTDAIDISRIRQAMSTFLLQFTSQNSKFDRVNGGTGEMFTAMEQEGWNIFTGKGRCYSCHNGINFSGYFTMYENIGLDADYADAGRGKITKNSADNGKFLVPTLRNIALSAPYMHDGRYKTLREVIDHYSDDIQYHPNLSWVFNNGNGAQSVNLTESEKKSLEAFLGNVVKNSWCFLISVFV